jgi:predicted Zn-dependent protease with MMP-like domain
MDSKAFERLVGDAVDSIPEAFLRYIHNVVFLVEPEADDDTLEALGLDTPTDLLGLYQGDPLTARGVDDYGNLPDQILLYQHPIEQYARETGEPVLQVIRETILHETGNYFGLSDEELARMGLE